MRGGPAKRLPPKDGGSRGPPSVFQRATCPDSKAATRQDDRGPGAGTGPTGPEANAAVRVFVASAIASTGQCIGLEWAQSHGACPAAVTADTVSTDLTFRLIPGAHFW